MYLDCTLCHIFLRHEVFHFSVYLFSISISDDCVLNEFIVFEPISFRIDCIEVSLFSSLLCPKSFFKISSLSIFFLRAHFCKIQPILDALEAVFLGITL